MVKVEARALDGATSASSLGARRSGSGVIIDERLVLTIGYLLLEVESVEVTTASGRKVPGTVAGYDHTSGFGLVRTALPMDGKRIELGDSDRVAALTGVAHDRILPEAYRLTEPLSPHRAAELDGNRKASECVVAGDGGCVYALKLNAAPGE